MKMTFVKAVLTVIVAGHLLAVVSAELEMLTSSDTLNVQKSQTVVLLCRIQDQGSRKVIWKNLKDGSKISVNSQILSQIKNKYMIERPQDSQAFAWNLRIYDVQIEDQAHYQCMVENTNVSVIHTVIVEGASTTPAPQDVSSDFNVTSCCVAHNMSSSCLPVCYPAGLPPNFDMVSACVLDLDIVVKCGTDGRNHVGCCKRRNLPVQCMDFCYGIMPATIDDSHVECLNQLDSILACLEEGREYLPGPPTSVSVVQRVSDNVAAMLVMWKQPEQNPNLVTGYKVFYKLTTDDHYTSTAILNTDQMMYSQLGLQIDKQYSVYVVALGSHGASQPSQTFIVTIFPAQPKSETEADIRACCETKGVRSECLPKVCTADIMLNPNPVEILQCYDDLNKALHCLVGQRNHSACCQRNGLPDICLSICAGQPTELTLDYTACVIRMPVIDACVQEGRATIPGPPVNITVRPGVNDAVISWSNSGASATDYTVRYKVLGLEGAYNTRTVSAPPIQLVYLYPGTHYEIQMSASNENGSSLMSTKVVFLTYETEITTPAPIQPGELHNLTACCSDKKVRSDCMTLCSFDVMTSGSLDLNLALTCMDQLGDILSCASDGRDHSVCCKEALVPDTCDSICRFSPHTELTSELITCATYTGTIANCYREGLATLPRQPRNFTVVDYTTHAVYLSWQQPEATSTRVESYVVTYHMADDTDSDQWKSMSTKNLEVIVNNLKPSTAYYFKVVSVNENGTSAPTPELRVVTRPFYNATANCNYTVKNNTGIRSQILPQSLSGTVEDCKFYCDIPACQGFTYSRQGQACTLYLGRTLLQSYPTPGFDFYNHTCPRSPRITPPGNWSVQYQNRSDCCHGINISTNCLDACLNGDFQSVYRCEADYHKILTCATDGRDHAPCCQRNGVPDICLPYCRGQLLPTTGINSLCLTYSPLYMRCFLNGTRYLPSPPKYVTVKPLNGTTMWVYWAPPDENCDQTNRCRYVVYYNQTAKERQQMGATETKALLTGLSSETAYTVSLLAINQYGSSISTPAIRFVTPPIASDVDISVSQTPVYPPPENGQVELFCNVYSAGRTFPFIKWVRHNTVIATRRQLKMLQLSERSEGNYTCSAKDNLGIVTNYTHYLRVMYKPKAVNLMDQKYLPNQMQVANLQCDFVGYPTEIHWFKGEDKRPLTDFKDYFHAKEKLISYPTFQRSVLSLYYVVDQAFDRYTCVGSNEIGKGEGIVQLKNDLPKPPATLPPAPPRRNVSACCASYEMPAVCQELCTFEMDMEAVAAQPDKYGQCLAFLEIYTTCASDGKNHSKCCQAKGVHPFCIRFCEGYVPDDTDSIYMMNCITDNKKMLQCVQENIDFLPSPPTLRALQKNDVIEVSWDKPKDNAHRVEHYELFWQGSDIPDSPQQRSLARNITDHKIKKIKEGVVYSIWVIAVNQKGSSQSSNKKNITVTNLKPSKPTSLHVTDVNGESVVLRWDPPENHAVVKTYTIKYREAVSNKPFKEFTVPGSLRVYVVRNLEPTTLYDFQLIANGPNGKSQPAALQSLNSGPSTSGKKDQRRDNSAVPLGIGLTVVVLLLAGGLVAVYLYCRRKRKMSYGETVSFENPQYGSRVQISGLPNSNYDSTSDEGFGYAPLREDRDVEHRPTDKSNLRDEATIDVTIT